MDLCVLPGEADGARATGRSPPPARRPASVSGEAVRLTHQNVGSRRPSCIPSLRSPRPATRRSPTGLPPRPCPPIPTQAPAIPMHAVQRAGSRGCLLSGSSSRHSRGSSCLLCSQPATSGTLQRPLTPLPGSLASPPGPWLRTCAALSLRSPSRVLSWHCHRGARGRLCVRSVSF